MTEAHEIGVALQPPQLFRTYAEAARWLSERWPDWRECIGPQLFDNIAETLVEPNPNAAKN